MQIPTQLAAGVRVLYRHPLHGHMKLGTIAFHAKAAGWWLVKPDARSGQRLDLISETEDVEAIV